MAWLSAGELKGLFAPFIAAVTNQSDNLLAKLR